MLSSDNEIVNINCQCKPDANPLFAEFRADISCFTLRKFLERGLTKEQLLEFQKDYPIIYPWDENYDFFRFDVNRRFNVFPWMIITAENDKDILFGLELAKKHKIPLSLRSGSHSFEGFSLVEGIIIDQSKRKTVWINKQCRTFSAESGTLLGPLAVELYKYKLFEPSGTCANNGLFGLTLGGGIGFTSKTYGLTCDNLLELEMILASGQKVTVNDKEYSDLFWACKGGGGGNFGIVTKMKLQAYHIDNVYLYSLRAPLTKENLENLLPLWQDIAPRFPKKLSSDFGIGEREIDITGLYIGANEQKLRKLLTPFIEKVSVVEINYIPYIDAVRYFTGSARWRPFYKVKNSFIAMPLPQASLPIILKYCSEPRGGFVLNLLGGQVAKVKSHETAFAYRKSLFWLIINAQWDNQYQEPDSVSWITNLYNELSPYFPGHVYVNAPDLAIPNYLAQYYGDNLRRLIHIKKKYDPENIFRYPQSIPTE